MSEQWQIAIVMLLLSALVTLIGVFCSAVWQWGRGIQAQANRTEARLDTHESVCTERHQTVLDRQEDMNGKLDRITELLLDERHPA